MVAVVAAVLFGLAAPASAEAQMEVEAPVGLTAGSPATFVVTLTADQATKGTIVISFEGAEFHRQVVEVPGGSTKDFVIVSSAPPWGSQAVITFDPERGQRQTARMNIDSEQADKVAVLAEVDGQPGRSMVDPAAGDRPVALIEFDPALLDHGPVVLSSVPTVMTTGADLGSLSPTRALALAAWVTEGGWLLVDGTPADATAALGLAPDTSEALGRGAGLAWVGEGSVRMVDGPAAGRVDGIVMPRTGVDEMGMGFDGGIRSTARSLAEDSGISILNIGPIMGFLIIYILVIGPGLWFLLRSMNRQPLVWLIVPAVAIVATAGIWAVGQLTRSGAGGAYASLVIDAGPVRTTRTETLVYSRSGGYVGLRLADGWTTSPAVIDPWMQFDHPGSEMASGELEGENLGRTVPPAGVALLGGIHRGPSSEPSWLVELDPVDETGADSLTGRVTNNTPHRLHGVLVSVGNGVTEVGDLEPGETAGFELDDIHGGVRFGFEGPEFDPVSQALRDMERRNRVDVGLYQQWHDLVERSSSSLIVIGWTDEAGVDLTTVSGDRFESGRTGFVTTMPVQDAGDVLSAFAGRGRSISNQWAGDPRPGLMVDAPGVAALASGTAADGPDNRSAPVVVGSEPVGDDQHDEFDPATEDEMFIEEQFAIEYLFEVHPDVDPSDQLALTITDTTSVAFWDGETWAASGVATLAEEGGGTVATIDWAVPESAVIDGMVLVQVVTQMWGSEAPRLWRPMGHETLAWTVES